jgi:hypothetical protein
MKTKKMIFTMFASLLIMAACLTVGNSYAQTKTNTAIMKDCCMMKDGKMMQMKGGKMMSMDKDITMKNGNKCMANGECIMKDGKKMKMKEGECMDMNGKMDMCAMMGKEPKGSTQMTNEQDMDTTYVCPMHPGIKSKKPHKCAKCGMDMIKKK